MKQRKIKGILLILAGIAICAIGIGVFTAILEERFDKNVYNYFETFADYFWAVSKANMVVSIVLGCIPAGIGIYLLCTKPWWAKNE